MMKFSAAYRSVLETVTVLILTGILDDEIFSRFISGIYPIYFVANLLFSSSTVDFAGGKREATLSGLLLIIAIPVFLLFAITQNLISNTYYFVFAGLTAVESVAFVYCEAAKKRRFLLLMLAPRAILVTGIAVLLVMGSHLSLEATAHILLFRDLSLVLIGIVVLILLRREFSFRFYLSGLKIGEISYLLISNANDFVLRIIVSFLFGGAFLKELEYALRLPKIAQAGLMLIIRNQIFAREAVSVRSMRMMQLHVIVGLSSSVIFFTYLFGFINPIPLMVASAVLSSSAVLWYVRMLRGRRFAVLTTTQVLSFGVTIMSIVASADAYVSTFFLAVVLFLFSFDSELRDGG